MTIVGSVSMGSDTSASGHVLLDYPIIEDDSIFKEFPFQPRIGRTSFEIPLSICQKAHEDSIDLAETFPDVLYFDRCQRNWRFYEVDTA